MARIRGLHPASNPSKSTSSCGDPPYRKKGAAAVGLQRFWQGLLLAALLVLPLSSTEAGDIWITGHDVDWHGGQNGYDYHVFEYLRNGTPALVTDYEIAIIGTTPGAVGTSPPSGWSASGPFGDYRNQMTFYSTTNLDTGTAGPNFDRDWGWVLDPINTDCLVILSHDSILGCSLTDFGVVSLNSESAAIQSAFNSGMDLFVLSGYSATAYYNFLPPDFIVSASSLSASSNFYITPAGCIAGIEGNLSFQCGTTNMVNECTHNHFGYVGGGGPGSSCISSYSPLLEPMETYPQIASDGPDGDPCEVVISLAANNIILPGDCIEVVEETIECIPVDEGGFDYSAQLTNISDFDVVKMFIPDVVDPVTGETLVDIEPNVIQGFPPVENGDPLPDLNLTFSGVASGDDFTYTVALMAKNEDGLLFECCSHEMEVSLPVCCNDLVEDSIVVSCKNTVTGAFQVDFQFLNWGHIDPTTAAHAFLLPIFPTNSAVFFEPDYIDLVLNGGEVVDGNVSDPLTTYIYGAGLGEVITFELIIHNADMSECCNQVHTIVTSDCVYTPDDGGGGGSASSDASFLRGDANTDGSFDIADVILSLGYLFQDLPVSCLLALDSNDDQTVDIGDSIYSLNALFGGGPSPGPPHQQCGDDTSAGTLDCDSFPLCDTANNDSQGG